MTITQTFNESQKYSIGDILNLNNMFSLSGVLTESDIYVTILVTSHTNPLLLQDDGYSNEQNDLKYSHVGNNWAFINSVRFDQLGNIGLPDDQSDPNTYLKLNHLGLYDILIHTQSYDSFISIRVNVNKQKYELRYKSAPTASLGTFGTSNTDDKLLLTHIKDSLNDIASNFDVYNNNSQVTNLSTLNYIYDKISKLTFSVKLDGVIMQVGGIYGVELAGDYQMALQSYESDVFILEFTPIIINVDEKSYSSLRFITPIEMEYGSAISKIYSYLTTDDIETENPTQLNDSNFGERDIYTLQLVTDGGVIVEEPDIPTTPPGMFLLTASFPGTGNNVKGLLSITKAKIKIGTTLSSSYAVTGGTLSFTDLFYVEECSSGKKLSESITFTVRFISSTGVTSNIVSSLYTLNGVGVLEILATYEGNNLYHPAKLQAISTIGPTQVDITSPVKYFFTQSEFTSNRKTEIEQNILSNLIMTNRTTGEIIDSNLSDSIKSFSTIYYVATTPVARCFVIYYTLTDSQGVEGSILTSTESSFVNFTNFINSKGGNTHTVSIKGITVCKGAQLELHYTSVDGHVSVTLDPSETGEAYKIDATESTTGATYVDIQDSEGGALSLGTNVLTYGKASAYKFTDLSDLPNGLYKSVIFVTVKTAEDDGIDSDEYIVVSQIIENILVTDELTISIDLLSYVIDRISATNKNVDYLFQTPQLTFQLGSEEADYKIGSSYLAVQFTGGTGSDVSVPEEFLTGLLVTPNLAYVSSIVSDNKAELLYGSDTPGLDVYNNGEKLDISSTFNLKLHSMVIEGVKSDLLTWFSNNGITLNCPTEVTSDDNIPTVMDHISSNIETLIPQVEALEVIVLDEDTTNTSRPFWIGLINKLSSLKSNLDVAIRTDPGSYLNNNDIDAFYDYTYNDVNVQVDLSTFETADLNYLNSIPETYTILINNEINTLVLKKHILSSMIAIKCGLLNKLTMCYISSDFSFSASLNGSVTIEFSSFTGVSGSVSLTLTLTVTNTETATGRIDRVVGSKTITYGSAPSTVTGTYTKPDGATGSAIFALTSSSGNTFVYTLNEATEIKGSEGIVITGFARSKTVDEQTGRRLNEETTTTESMIGTVAVTGSQLTTSD